MNDIGCPVLSHDFPKTLAGVQLVSGETNCFLFYLTYYLPGTGLTWIRSINKLVLAYIGMTDMS